MSFACVGNTTVAGQGTTTYACIERLCLVGDNTGGRREPNRAYTVGVTISGLDTGTLGGSDKDGGWTLWYLASGMTELACAATSKSAQDSEATWSRCSLQNPWVGEPPSTSDASGASQLRSPPTDDVLRAIGFPTAVDAANALRGARRSGANDAADPADPGSAFRRPNNGSVIPPYPASGVCNALELDNPLYFKTFNDGTSADVVVRLPPTPYPGGPRNQPLVSQQYRFSTDLIVVFYLQNGLDTFNDTAFNESTGAWETAPITTALIGIPTTGSPYGSDVVGRQIHSYTDLFHCGDDLDCPWPMICNGPPESSSYGADADKYKVCVNPVCVDATDCWNHGTCTASGQCLCDAGFQGRLDCSLVGTANSPASTSSRNSAAKSRLAIYIGIGAGAAVLLIIIAIAVVRHKSAQATRNLRDRGYQPEQAIAAAREQQAVDKQ